MGKMPFSDWKEWATKRPEWVRGDLGVAFKGFVEKKRRDALNVAAAEPQAWEPEAPKKDRGHSDKPAGGRAAGEKPAPNTRGLARTVGAANVVIQQLPWGHKKCKVQEQTGCGGNRMAIRCGRLRELSPQSRRKALEASRLCLFCLRHPASADCYYRGGRTKPACAEPGCKGGHAVGRHDLLGGVKASVSLVMEEEEDSEDDKNDEADLYINVSRAGQEDDDWQEPDDSWLELDGGENEDDGGIYCVNAFIRGEDSGLEEEFEYYPDVSPSRNEETEEKTKEERWWSPDLSWVQLEGEAEGKTRYLDTIPSEGQDTGEDQVPASHSGGREIGMVPLPSERGRSRSGGNLERRRSATVRTPGSPPGRRPG